MKPTRAIVEARKRAFDLDKAFAQAKRDAAKLDPWKVAFIAQVDNQGKHEPKMGRAKNVAPWRNG